MGAGSSTALAAWVVANSVGAFTQGEHSQLSASLTVARLRSSVRASGPEAATPRSPLRTRDLSASVLVSSKPRLSYQFCPAVIHVGPLDRRATIEPTIAENYAVAGRRLISAWASSAGRAFMLAAGGADANRERGVAGEVSASQSSAPNSSVARPRVSARSERLKCCVVLIGRIR